MKKIAIDLRMWVSGGIGSYIRELLPFFVNNNECLLLCYTKDIPQVKSHLNLTDDKLCKIMICDIKPFSLKELFSFPKNLREAVNSCDAFFSPYCNVPAGIKIPFFSTVHDVVFLDVKGLASFSGTLIRKFFYKRAISASKAVFTVSEFSKGRILHHFKTTKPVPVIYNSVPSYIKNDDGRVFDKDNSILFVGNIKRHKGLHTLLKAFKIVLDKIPEAKLVIVGNGDNFRSGDDSIAKEFNSIPSENFEFTGRISDEKLKEYYKKARLLVQPSLYEGFGIPPLEALMCGTNAVISDIDVFKEIYGSFPVVFFKCQDENDLAEKIAETYGKEAPEKVPDIYSYKKSYEIIMNYIEEI